MASLFEAYITNLGKYNEGELVGETLKFPTTTEEVQGLLKRIGVDGVRYEEFFITSFDGDVLGLYDYLTEYENLDELNHLACLLSELDQGDLEKFEAVIDSGEHTSSVADLINLAQNLDCYEFYPGVEDDETLGRIYVEDMEAIDIPDHLLPYFDYEAYGRDVRINEDGHFAPGGYEMCIRDRYGDEELVPDKEVRRAGWEWNFFLTQEKTPLLSPEDVPLQPVDVMPGAQMRILFTKEPSELRVMRAVSDKPTEYLELSDAGGGRFSTPTTPGLYFYKVRAEWSGRGFIQYYFALQVRELQI